MISKRLVSGVAVAFLGTAGLATVASAIHADAAKPAVHLDVTHNDTSRPDVAISLKTGAPDGPTDSTDNVDEGPVGDSQTDNVDEGQVGDSQTDNVDEGQVGDSQTDNVDEGQVGESQTDNVDQGQVGDSQTDNVDQGQVGDSQTDNIDEGQSQANG